MILNYLLSQATDKDSGNLGKVEYRLVPDESKAAEYFNIDASSGTLRTRRGLDSVSEDKLPLRLQVEARDNPSNSMDSNVVITEVVVSQFIT